MYLQGIAAGISRDELRGGVVFPKEEENGDDAQAHDAHMTSEVFFAAQRHGLKTNQRLESPGVWRFHCSSL